MNEPADPQPSDDALRALLSEARRAGGHRPEPEAPDWLAAAGFPVEIERYIGHGGSGFVWRGRMRCGEAPVALKWVPFSPDPERLAARWEAECAALERVEHPNLVRCLAHGLAPDGQSGWLAMEWIEGASLEEWLEQQGRLDPAPARELVAQVSEGLAELHGAGLVHRDIKPSNLLFEHDTGRWVVADFGIVHDLRLDRDWRLTRTREGPVTPGYAPPESRNPACGPDARWDQFSLAFTVWEALCRKQPVGAFSRLHDLCSCPRGIDRVLRRALSTDRDHRFAGQEAFARAFDRAARRPPWLRPLLAFALIGAAIGVVGGALVQIERPPPFPREFSSEPLRVTEGRGHFMEIDLTLEEDGEFLAVVRTRSEDLLHGFTGLPQVIWKDRDGNVLKVQKGNPYGVNGRLIAGAPHERVDYWRDRLPPEMAAQVERVDFLATPGGISKEARDAANRQRLEKDLRKIRAGLEKAWESVKPE